MKTNAEPTLTIFPRAVIARKGILATTISYYDSKEAMVRLYHREGRPP